MKPLMAIVLLCFLTSAACSKDAPQAVANKPDSTANGTYPPVENNAPNAAYQPAFAGQTRAPGIRTQTPLEVTVLSKDLDHPWGIITLPDGRLLITQKGGTMRLAKADGTLSAPITGLPAVANKGQGGLLDVAADPEFPQNRLLYWTFSEPVGSGNLTAVAKGKLSADEKRIENPQVIFRATPAYNGDKHFGGRLLFDRSGNLFVSTGERSDLETRPKAQDLSTALGKVLHITRDGQPVGGNPFTLLFDF